jgi:internalin A
MQRLFTVVVAAFALIGGAGGAAPADEKRPEPLPADVVAAWQKAGAVPGWLGVDDKRGILEFRRGAAGKAGEVAAFSLRDWEPGVLGKLPPPGLPFALSLVETQMTDAGLKELAGLKQLQWLDLYSTEVTDAGLREMTGLKQLKRLDLSSTKVTDAGLKELAGLKQLKRLYFVGTKVTEAGVAELRKALPECRIDR